MIKRLLPSPLVTAPKVSVVIPCDNYGRYLPAAVASALDQPGVDIEVIIADNGSTDDSLAIARKLSEADTRIAVTTQPFNQEYLVNYNDGIKKTTGKYIVVLDADDLLTPGSITRSAALMEARPNVVFAYGYTPRFTEVPPKPHLSVRSWSVWRGLDWIDWLYRTGRNVIISPEVLIRASVLHELGGFDTDYPVGADLLLWLQCARQGDVARVNGPDQAFGTPPPLRPHQTPSVARLHSHPATGARWVGNEVRHSVNHQLAHLLIEGRTVLVTRRDLPLRVVRQACDHPNIVSFTRQALSKPGCVRRDPGGFRRIVDPQDQYSQRIHSPSVSSSFIADFRRRLKRSIQTITLDRRSVRRRA